MQTQEMGVTEIRLCALHRAAPAAILIPVILYRIHALLLQKRLRDDKNLARFGIAGNLVETEDSGVFMLS